MDSKVCSSCKTLKPHTSFYIRKTRNNQPQAECKDCCKQRRSKWWKSTTGKESSRNTKLKQRFGIDIAQYEELLRRQNYQCLICKETQSTNGHRLAVDHCHKTGQIRGLLCKACNVSLGGFRDSITNLYNAILYLENFYG